MRPICGDPYQPRSATQGTCSRDCARRKGAEANRAKAAARQAAAAEFTRTRAERSPVGITSDVGSIAEYSSDHSEIIPDGGEPEPAPRSDEGHEPVDTTGMPLGQTLRIRGLETAREEAQKDLEALLAAAERAQLVIDYLDGKILDLVAA